MINTNHTIARLRRAVLLARATDRRWVTADVGEMEALLALIDAPCCSDHGRVCEPPSELCCGRCSEAGHPDHADGRPCSAPDLSRTVPR